MKNRDIKINRWYRNCANEYFLTIWNFDPQIKEESEKINFKNLKTDKYTIQSNKLLRLGEESISDTELQQIPLDSFTLTNLFFDANDNKFIDSQAGVFEFGNFAVIFNKDHSQYRIKYFTSSETVTSIDEVQDFIEMQIR